MKKVKILFWLVLFGFIALFVYQNKDFFMAYQSFQLNLYLAGPYHTPNMPNVMIFLVFFFLGLLIAYFYSLFGSYRQNKTIRNLNGTVAAQSEEIATLRGKLGTVHSPSAPENDTRVEPTSSTPPLEA